MLKKFRSKNLLFHIQIDLLQIFFQKVFIPSQWSFTLLYFCSKLRAINTSEVFIETTGDIKTLWPWLPWLTKPILRWFIFVVTLSKAAEASLMATRVA
jgi:hypothetical protein